MALLLEALNSDRYVGMLRVLDEGARRPPLVGRADAGGTDQSGPALVHDKLARAWRQARRAYRALGPEPRPEDLHRLRIAAKHLRYGGEAAAPVLGSSARAVAESAETVQTLLGEHQDAYDAERWGREVALRAGPKASFAAGLVVAGERERMARSRRALRPAWREVARAARSAGLRT